VNQHIAILRPDPSRVNPRFLAYFLASESGMRQFQRLNDRGAKAGLNLVNLGNLELPELPIKEQEHISEALRQVDEAEAKANSRRQSIQALRRQLLGFHLLQELPGGI
jgi:restriction endonuclease S subunit